MVEFYAPNLRRTEAVGDNFDILAHVKKRNGQ